MRGAGQPALADHVLLETIAEQVRVGALRGHGVAVDRGDAGISRRLKRESFQGRGSVHRQPGSLRMPAEALVGSRLVAVFTHLGPIDVHLAIDRFTTHRPEPCGEWSFTVARLERRWCQRLAAVKQGEAVAILNNCNVVGESALIEAGRGASPVEERVLEKP